MEKVINGVKWFITVVGSLLTSFFGGSDSLLMLLLILCSSDMTFGGAKGWKNKQFSSSIFFWGIVNKAVIFIIIGIMVKVDTVFGFGIFRNAFIIWFSLCEGASIIENTAALGVPWPDGLLSALVQVRKGFSINISKIVKQIIDNYKISQEETVNEDSD